MSYKIELDPPLSLDAADQDFLTYGIQDLAYIRRVSVGEDVSYMIHAADGTPISTMEDHTSAIAAVLTNGLEPSAIH